MKQASQHGIAHIGAVAVAVLLFGGISMLAYQMVSHKDSSVSGIVTVSPTLPASITSSGDVKQAAAALDHTDNASVNPTKVDDDLLAML